MCTKEALDWPYNLLGLTEIPQDKKPIKRAYARRLKTIDQLNEPDAFQQLREAYEAALDMLSYKEFYPEEHGEQLAQGAADTAAREHTVAGNNCATATNTPLNDSGQLEAKAGETQNTPTPDDSSPPLFPLVYSETPLEELQEFAAQFIAADNERSDEETISQLIHYSADAPMQERQLIEASMLTLLDLLTQEKDDSDYFASPITPHILNELEAEFQWTKDAIRINKTFPQHLHTYQTFQEQLEALSRSPCTSAEQDESLFRHANPGKLFLILLVVKWGSEGLGQIFGKYGLDSAASFFSSFVKPISGITLLVLVVLIVFDALNRFIRKVKKRL
ncbi:hypothetical protein [Polycladidibacter hongkongensis]|uniref:hypothetical protein n=1 Tax=Polycladidibacter hongkongensis TaxID=1647556 RepID=UPI00083779A5|nr:hypothetical protein [Pseudovibrio hongkongensis]